jgi:hyperosmotically inducible protein
MKTQKPYLVLLTLVALGAAMACTTAPTKSADVSGPLRTSLDQAGLKEVSIDQERDKGVVILSGQVATDAEKTKAEMIAKSIAGTQVVSNQIAVVALGAESDAKKINSELDKGIENNLTAALVQAKLQDSVKYSVKNHVVTLSGEVDTEATRTRAGQVAAGIVNVQQVVNEIQLRKQKSTSSN